MGGKRCVPMLVLCLLLSLIASASSLTFELNAHREQCFYEEVKAGVRVLGSYMVSEGGLMDVDVTVKGPGDKVLFSKEKEGEGRFTFNAETDGEYSFCFSNKMSSVTKKIVSFTIEIGEGDVVSPKGELAKQGL